MTFCELCGEPMPEGETMFKFHGYSGPCPKPALPKPSIEVVIEYLHRKDAAGYWLILRINRVEERKLGPFDTTAERQYILDGLLSMMRGMGAKDLPATTQ